MEDKKASLTEESRISQQNLRLTIVSRHPRKPQEAARREIERRLSQIFRKYV